MNTPRALTPAQRRDLHELIEHELSAAWDAAVSRGEDVAQLRETVEALLHTFATTEDVRDGRDDAADDGGVGQ